MLKIKSLSKRYGDKIIYENFDLDIQENKILAVLGNSGCGKTTLLKILSGLTSYQGEIEPFPKKVSCIFGEDRLLPHKTVKENLLFVSPDADIDGALERVGLLGEKDRYPSSLSTGMARRVSVLRAFLYDAPLMLIDEPFRNLDLSLKAKLIAFFKELYAKNAKTVILVTHDVDEAVDIADRCVIINDGKLAFDTLVEDKETAKKSLTEKLLNL